ncbi:MAG: hypothetical protein QXP78_05110 [Candidatus Bathyarchaeia archaeon]
MSSSKILRKEFYDKLVCCPKCNKSSLIFPRYKCPKYGSLLSECLNMHIVAQ